MNSEARLHKLKEMLETSPDDVFLNYALAMEHRGMNDLVLAQAYFKRTLELDPSHVAAYYQLGELLMQHNQTAEAIQHLEAGVQQAKLKKDAKAVREIQALLDELLD